MSIVFVLGLVCFAVIPPSLQADAVDEVAPCNSSTLEQVVAEIKSEIRDQISHVKNLLASNPTGFEAAGPTKQALVSAFLSTCVPLLIQQNVDGSDFFNRSWAEFKVGFDDPRGNYWLGNELLSQLTGNGRHTLKFDLQSRSNTSEWYYAKYRTFAVLAERSNYLLLVSGYSGNAGDSFRHHNGARFSTYDRDNDLWSSGNCAAYHGGGFWHKSCDVVEVNLPRVGGGGNFGWDGLPGGRALQSSRMWLQCK